MVVPEYHEAVPDGGVSVLADAISQSRRVTDPEDVQVGIRAAVYPQKEQPKW